MYIEAKTGELAGQARIARMRYSKTGRSVHYSGKTFQAQPGGGIEGNYFDTETMDEYWISGCKKDGSDPLFSAVVEIDDDVREEYWVTIRRRADLVDTRKVRFVGKHSRQRGG